MLHSALSKCHRDISSPGSPRAVPAWHKVWRGHHCIGTSVTSSMRRKVGREKKKSHFQVVTESLQKDQEPNLWGLQSRTAFQNHALLSTEAHLTTLYLKLQRQQYCKSFIKAALARKLSRYLRHIEYHFALSSTDNSPLSSTLSVLKEQPGSSAVVTPC